MKYYQAYCTQCQVKTPHTPYQYNRKKGVKLRCAKCGAIKTQYRKGNQLKPILEGIGRKDEN